VLVWIDGSPAFSEKTETLSDAKVDIRGFHDDYKNPSTNTAYEQTLSAAKSILENPAENLLAVIVNNSEEHKKILQEILRICREKSWRIPYFAACTKATKESFEGCEVQICERDRVKVQQEVVAELARRGDAT